MINFRIDGRSAVPPYLQIVQQVRQALRMGVLDVGDQLPTVREVVAATAVNPNTVLKAYRDLEREGLVQARAGHGTFVLSRPPGPPPGTTPGSAAAWPGGCGKPARPGSTMSRSNRCCASRCRQLRARRRSHEPRVIQTRGLVKRFRRVTALSDCDVTVPEGRICALIGPNGAGKTTLLRLLAGLARPTAGEMSVLGGTPRQDPAFLAEVGFLAQEIPLYRRFTAGEHISVGAHLNQPLGRGVGARPADVAEYPAGPRGGLAVRGPASPARADAPLAKKPRWCSGRTGRRAGPAGPAALPGHHGERSPTAG